MSGAKDGADHYGSKEGPHIMRHQYTPIFADVLTSRIWAMAPSTRSVWLWLMLRADPEGFVCADAAGVAIGANVTLDAARDALAELSEADPEAEPGTELDGRIIVRVPRGWRLLGFELGRELAKLEGQKARNRRYMARYRAAANEASNDESTVDASGLQVDVPKPIPKPKPLPEDREIPPTPQPVVIEPEPPSEPVPTIVVSSRVLMAIPATWQPSQSLRDDATMAGVTDFDERLASLRSGPIGGTRGVFEHWLEDYVRSFFGKWRTWGETDRAKAANRANPDWKNGAWRGGPVKLEPTGKHRAYAKKHGLDIDKLARELTESGAVDDLGAKRALELLGSKMSLLVRERREAAA